MASFFQRPKKSKLSGWQILTRKNFLDGACKLFSRQIHKKRWVNCFGNIYINTFLKEFIIRKVSKPSGKFPDHPESFQIIRKVQNISGSFPDHPESFQTIRKVSRSSRKFPDHPECAKHFRVVMPPRDMGFSVSAFHVIYWCNISITWC